ncbi:tetratricopeptide repeat protein [Zobellella aerophila]|uniref:Tetratricopeptide repeat protein n=1 Tax=Zobellella aerophila TaxID=870480 RepID=A0ABP6VB27_9GAMM
MSRHPYLGLLAALLSSWIPAGWASERSAAQPEFADEWQAADWSEQLAELPAPGGELSITEVTLSRPERVRQTQEQADLALAEGDWARAEYRLARLLAEYPDEQEIRLRLAAMQYGRGALDDARVQLQQGLTLAPRHADMRLALARLLAEQQRYSAAFGVLDGAVPEVASHLDYYSLKAEMARRSGDCDSAVELYHRLLVHAPDVGAWWLSLGLCQRSLGQDFVPAYQRALASADLGTASLRFVRQQLEQYGATQTH